MTGHAGLAAGRWATLSLAEQLANVGSEVQRAIHAWEAQRSNRFDRALARALDLFDLTARDDRWRGPRRREVLRAREEFCRLFFDEHCPPGAARTLNEYFLRFAVLARQRSKTLMPPDPGEPVRRPRIPGRDPSELPGAAQCWVCLQIEDDERTRETQVLVSLVGAAANAVCARCGQEAPDREDAAYLTRVRRYLGALAS
jgi:hypothetical protein